MLDLPKKLSLHARLTSKNLFLTNKFSRNRNVVDDDVCRRNLSLLFQEVISTVTEYLTLVTGQSNDKAAAAKFGKEHKRYMLTEEQS